MRELEKQNKIYYYHYNLQFFAKEGDGGEKTEEATSKKLTDARDKGQVAKSQELISAVALFALFVVLKIFVGYLGEGFIEVFQFTYTNIDQYLKGEFNIAQVSALMLNNILEIIKIAAPVFIASFVTALAVNIVQVKWKITTEPLKPTFSKLNPISGMKRLISKDKIVELLKSILKIAAITYVVYNTLEDKWRLLIQLYDITLYQAISLIGNMVISLGMNISALFLVIGFADYIYQKRKFKVDMRMTKQEIKDEYKQTEGDPKIKGKIRSKMQEASRRRMMQRIPEADVIITNPTHFAAAIKYDKEVSDAPILIAKGADHLAQKIKEIARENRVEIVENKPLARMLYYNVEVEDEVPPELYQMTAEVLAYVYSLKNKI